MKRSPVCIVSAVSLLAFTVPAAASEHPTAFIDGTSRTVNRFYYSGRNGQH